MANYPRRYQQREHTPEQENPEIRKDFKYFSPQSYTFYYEEIDKLKKIIENSSLLSNILSFMLFVFFSALLLYAWFNHAVVIPTIVNFLFIQGYFWIILSISVILAFRYPIYIGKSCHIHFRPLDLQWKVTYAVEIKSAPRDLPRLTTLLKNMPFLTLYQINDFDTKTTKLVITASQHMFFSKITPNKVREIIHSVLSSTSVIYSPTNIPKIQFQQYHYLKTSKLYLQLDVLVSQLKKNKVSGQLMVVTRFHKDYVDTNYLKIESLYQVYIGFSTPNLDKWMGLMNTVSFNVKHRPYFSYLLDHYSPVLWTRVVRLLRFPGISWYTELVTRNLVYADKLEQAFKFPRFDHHSPQIFEFRNPGFDTETSYILGNLVEGGVKTKKMGIPLADLAQGGIITGAIGTGKTTLRLHLMQQAREAGLRVIDFDLKGDATRYGQLIGKGKVVIPNRNFHLNPFVVPKGFTVREYANVVLQSFVETIPAGEELTPPQLHLLTRAIYKTVEEGGNARTFFKNLYIIGHQEQQLIDNNQQNTAQALITRFDWMQTVMHNIFWQSKSSLLVTDYAESSLFFDLSQLEMTATRSQIRFLINLIMARVIASIRNRKESQLSDIIFLDETQILMPRRRDHAELTKLEQTVTTLRYKGVSVIATGVSAELMSPVLLDVGFVAQFRSESSIMEKALGISSEQIKEGLIPQLPRYHALIRGNSIGSRPVMLHTAPFKLLEQIPEVKMPNSTPLARFELDYTNIWQSRLDAVIIPRLGLSDQYLRELQLLAVKFVKNEFTAFELQENKIIVHMTAAHEKIEKLLQSEALPRIVVNYQRQFLSLVLYAYILRLVDLLRYDTKLNLLDRSLETLVFSILKHVETLTQSTKSQQYDQELVRLKAYILQIEQYNHLDLQDVNAITVEIAALLEKLGRRLGAQLRGLSQILAEITAAGWLSPGEHKLLTDFVRVIRNPVVHGTIEYNSNHLTLIYRAARLTVRKIEEYRDVSAKFSTDFDITASDDE